MRKKKGKDRIVQDRYCKHITARNSLSLPTETIEFKRANIVVYCKNTQFPSPVKANGVRNNLHEERHIFLRQGGGGAHVFSQGRKRRSYAFEAMRVIKKKKKERKRKKRGTARKRSRPFPYNLFNYIEFTARSACLEFSR